MTQERLLQRVAYLAPAFDWAVRMACFGPSVVPVALRKLPLDVLSFVVRLHSLQ